MTGKFASCTGGSLFLEGGQEYPADLKCEVTLNGQPASFKDLQPGDVLEFDGKPAVKITATRDETCGVPDRIDLQPQTSGTATSTSTATPAVKMTDPKAPKEEAPKVESHPKVPKVEAPLKATEAEKTPKIHHHGPHHRGPGAH